MNEPSIDSDDNGTITTAAASTIGERLAIKREQDDLSTRDVAEQLRVSVTTVTAIEAGDWSRLGPSVYARGYVVAYGRLLGVDVSEALDHFKGQQSQPTAPPEFLRSSPAGNWHRYQRMAAYVAATALVAIPAAWVGKASFDRFLAEPVQVELTEQPANSSTSSKPVAITTVETDQELPVMASMAPVASPIPMEPEPLPQESPQSTDESISDPIAEPIPFQAERSEGNLELLLRADAWLEISNIRGQRLAFGLMQAGTRHRFPVENGLIVRIGNADEVQAWIDGRPFDLAPYLDKDLAKFELSPPDG